MDKDFKGDGYFVFLWSDRSVGELNAYTPFPLHPAYCLICLLSNFVYTYGTRNVTHFNVAAY
jgi:hypothetical protein